MNNFNVDGYINSVKNTDWNKCQYEDILKSLNIKDISHISETVWKSLGNLKAWKNRFVIYW
jgi:hypothetical protein